jgi:hypothetical protein
VHFTDFCDGITVVEVENLLRFEATKLSGHKECQISTALLNTCYFS